jgi:rare lipoprotein A
MDRAVPAVLALIVCFGCTGPSAELREGRFGAEQEGRATYYSPRLAGHRTASGEPYDPAQMTAAHPFLPFGTLVQVTRLDYAYPPVVVRINDRCAGRKKIIDLSEAAAWLLGMLGAGRVPVRLVVLSDGQHQMSLQ